MIAFNFIYYRPDSLKEAVNIFENVTSQGKTAVYYSGGSEIITMCRAGTIRPDAVIDIKCISNCRGMAFDQQSGLHIGAACTLNEISEAKFFSLLRLSGGRIADHTNQCRITLGGNLCGTIIYRETSLPLLICDASVTLFGPKGERTVAFDSVFDGRIHLLPGEMVVSVHIPSWAISARHFHVKKTANEKIDYPLITLSSIVKDGFLRIAFSGLCSYPFREKKLETVLNDRTKSISERVNLTCTLLPEKPLCDAKGSCEYRSFVLKSMLVQLLEEVGNG